MLKKITVAALAPATLLLASPNSLAASNAELEAQIRQMQAVIEQMQRQMQEKNALEQEFIKEQRVSTTSRQYQSGTGTQAGSVKASDQQVSIKLGGFANLVTAYDGGNGMNNPDSFIVSQIPIKKGDGKYYISDGQTYTGSGDQFHIGANQSRFSVEALTPSPFGTLKMFLEGDFHGGGNSFRLRHAYGQTGAWTLGQTWSTFDNLSANPATVDWQGAPGVLALRQPLIRYNHSFAEHWDASLALEDNSYASELDDISNDDDVAESINFDRPDLHLMLKNSGDWGNIQGNYVYTSFKGKPAFGTTANYKSKRIDGYGAKLSGVINITQHTALQLSAAYVDGASHYIADLSGSGNTLAIDDDGNVDTVTAEAYSVAIAQQWNDHLRSTFAYSMVDVDNGGYYYDKNDAGYIPGVSLSRYTESAYYVANIFWDIDEHITTGFEYLYGEREDTDGYDGDSQRVHFMTQYNFN
ncbi:hypothetical protein EDC56_3617 [Sinobacterium caligoides]|uniref:Porin-like protein n=1 Tax=Sinobacterium caligoides TaxID=933926 RepID=A0A3N2DE61_9GAMM|nr:DcaP family trimeric outer membrane transporter [Sinobacterium caligoides]ROR97948.1 hypothetical protein EDC56_3617 [Sinobacterium caligoides]